MMKDAQRFSILVEKYLASIITEEESEELGSLLEKDVSLQKRLAGDLILDGMIQEVINARYAVHEELGEGGQLKPFKDPDKKYKSQRFKKDAKILPLSSKEAKPQNYQKLIWLVAALVFLSLGGIYWLKQSAIEGSFHGLEGSLIGSVELYRDQKKQLIDKDKTWLRVGDIIETQENGYLEIRSKEGSVVLLGQNSKLILGHDGLQLTQGKLFAEISKSEERYLKSYRSGDLSKFTIKGTAFEVEESGRTHITTLAVAHGVVEFAYNGQKQLVRAGETFSSEKFGGNSKLEKVLVGNIARWRHLIPYVKHEKIAFFDLFDEDQVSEKWQLSGLGSKSQMLRLKPQEPLALSLEGKGDLLLRSPAIPLDESLLGVHFHSLAPQGTGRFEYGYIVYEDDKEQLKQSIMVLNQGDRGFLIQEVRYEYGKVVSKQPPYWVVTLSPIVFDAAISPVVEKAGTTFKKKKNDSLLADSNSQISAKTLSVGLFVSGKNNESQCHWPLSFFLMERDKNLAAKMKKKMLFQNGQ